MSDEPPPRRLGRGFAIGMTVFFVLGGVVSMFLMLPLAMAGDPCGQGNTEFRCSPTGQELLPWLPWLGLVAGLIVAGVGGAFVRRWAPAPASGLFGGGVIYVVTVVITLGYAAGGDAPQPAPVTQQQINTDYRRLGQRPDSETMFGRYDDVITAAETQLGPAVHWDTTNHDGDSDCASDFPAIDSLNTTDVEQWYFSTYATSTLDAAGWQQATAALTNYLADHGFTKDAEDTTYRDEFGTRLTLSTTNPIAITVDTGCFLTPTAKQRGTPPTGP